MTTAEDKAPLIVAPLIVALLTAHVSQDVVYGFEEGDASDLIASAIAGVWLFVALAFAGRRLGYLMLLVASFLAPVVSLAHMLGEGVAEDLPAGEGFFFVWTSLGLGVIAPISLLFSLRGFWRVKKGVPDFLLWTVVPIGLGAALLGYVIYALS